MAIKRRYKGDYTEYTREGTDKVIRRRKAGPTKQQISNEPQFERTRQNNQEFIACTRFTRGIRTILFPLKHLCDSFLIGGLNGLAKKIQLLDEESERGKRGILLSRGKHLLAGFLLKVEPPFESIVRHPVAVKTSRKTATATLTIPALVNGISLSLPKQAAYCRFVAVLGTMNDVVHGKGGFPSPDSGELHYEYTGWCHRDAPLQETPVKLQLPRRKAKGTLVLAIGIEFGAPDRYGEISALPKAGVAKILAVF